MGTFLIAGKNPKCLSGTNKEELIKIQLIRPQPERNFFEKAY